MRGQLDLKGDVAGGISVGALTIPMSMGYGLLAFQPLGDGYVSYGIVAGLFSAIVVLALTALLGGAPSLMYTPRSVVTLLMAAVVLEGVTKGPAAVATGGDLTRTLTLVFFIVLLTGVFQTAFGALRLGTFIRYIPSPVMAGFQNAVAVLIVLAQWHALLGVPQSVPLSRLGASLARIQPLTLGVGLFTALVMGFGQKLIRKVPPVILGLLAGTAVFYALQAIGYGAYLGPTLGRLPARCPCPGTSRASGRSSRSERSGPCSSPSPSAPSAWPSSPRSTCCSACGWWMGGQGSDRTEAGSCCVSGWPTSSPRASGPFPAG